MLFALLSRLSARRAVVFGALFAALAAALSAQSPSALDGFDPNVNGTVFALAAQPDGRVLVAGQFTMVGDHVRRNLARLNADGSVDLSFNPSPDAAVRAVVIQSDGRIVIGGDFSELQPNATGTAVARGRIARLNANGSIDASFSPHINGQPLPGGTGTLRAQVFALALQADGSILVGGSFHSLQPGNLTVIFERTNLLRLNSAGALDQSFDPHPNGAVLAIVPHVDNKIVIGGGFTSLWPAGNSEPFTRNRLARLNANGTVDPNFDPNANNGVTTLALQRDGKILVGGFFTALQPPINENPAPHSHFARLNVDGTLDADFFPRADGNVNAIAVQPDGGILVGGTFSSVWGRGEASVARSFVARFNPDSSIDARFAPTLNGAVETFAFQPDGKILLGGQFTRANALGRATPLVRNHVARLNLDGSLDADFQLDPGGRPLVSITQSDGRVVLGGSFTNVGGATHNYVARLNADGSVDATYNPELNGRVYAMAYESASNKVIIGGDFTTISGETRNYLARLNANGTLDPDFNPNLNARVGALVVQPDGKILVGGSFTTVTPPGATAVANRANLLRLNANGTLDTAFDPTPNSAVAAVALQSDGKIVIGGSFSALTPGLGNGTPGTTVGRNFIARLNADGTPDPSFNPTSNGQISALVVQPDGKIVAGGSFTGFAPPGATELTVRNRIARINSDGTIDAAFNPNANGNVLALALQPDNRILIGGSFITLQSNPDAPETLLYRKYVARLNADGSVDTSFDLDLSEAPGNRVDSLRVQSDGRVYLGGSFTSLQPVGTPTRIARENFARLAANGSVDTTFNPGVGGPAGGTVNALALQADGKVIAVGNFTDLGGAKSADIARFRPEGVPDPEFTTALSTDGTVNAVAVRPNATSTPTQISGLAWLNPNGTLRTAFAPNTRLSGEISAIAFQSDGAVLLGGSFANLNNTTAGNLVRFNANGTLDTSFNPAPNGQVTGIAVLPDGRIVIVGSFTTVGGIIRNRVARLDSAGNVDTTFDPNANARVNSVVVEPAGTLVIGGAFTTLTPNLATTAVTRNFIARINSNGDVDANYNPTPSAVVTSLALQADGKVVAGGAFTSVAPNGATTATNRSGIARFNTDGTLDQNFHPNANGVVNTVVALPSGQFLVGGSFTFFHPNETGPVHYRSNLAIVNSDATIAAFNPNPNGAVLTLALQSDGSVLAGGTFTTLHPEGANVPVTRNHIARLNPNGSLDLGFNPDLNGSISVVAARPDGSVLVGGNFNALQQTGSIVIGGSFATIGGVPAANLAMLNDNGSVNTNFRPAPDGAVNALMVQPDGKIVVGGAFSNIAGAARPGLARFNADGTLDAAFNVTMPFTGNVRAIALQPDGQIIVGANPIGGNLINLFRFNGAGIRDEAFDAQVADSGVQAISVQPDGRIVVAGVLPLAKYVRRLNADGSTDADFQERISSGSSATTRLGLALQADGKIVVWGNEIGFGDGRLARLNPNGTVDTSFSPAPNGAVTAGALQADGRLVIGGNFSRVGGQTRVGIARLGSSETATQMLGVSANRSTITWTRGGATGELSAVVFEQSSTLTTWTPLGQATRVAGTANWQLTGLTLPASGVFYIRARGIAPSSAGTSSGVYEMVREFNFANPVPAAAQASTTPAIAASQPAFDPFTGIAPRSTISVVPGEGSVEIFASAAALDATNAGLARLANLSTRGRVTPQNPLILGFAIAGDDARRVLIRGIGPGLAGFGVADALPATRIQVYDAAGAALTSGEGWSGAPDLAQTFVQTGAFPLTTGSADSAVVLTLAPGNYTVEVIDVRGTGGVALAEIYDADSGPGSRLVNVSSRGAAGAGEAALISGFVVAGDAPQRVLLRGIGPGLARFGATAAVADPSLSLFDAQGRVLGTNDNWVSSLANVADSAMGVGAFPLVAGSKDAAVLATLSAGAYTMQVSAASGTGTALLEIYSLR